MTPCGSAGHSRVPRRAFLGAVVAGVAAPLAATRLAAQGAMPGMAMQGGTMQSGTMQMRGANGAMMNMDQDAYRPVNLPPKPAPHGALDKSQCDALEHHLHCQCGCGLDVYTCRTTDFSCSVSPAMHRDVMSLAQEGYDAQEIIAAFRKVYGDGVLMAPAKEGFNWLAYTLPFGALLAGAAFVLTLLRRWSAPTSGRGGDAAIPVSDATPEELERLRAALRSDA